WRWTFVMFGTLGLAWTAPFAWWFHDEPTEHPAVNAAELRYIVGAPVSAAGPVDLGHPSVPWRMVLATPTIWLLGATMICAACCAASIHIDSPTAASMFLALALFGVAVQVCAWWGAMTDVSGPHIGALFGLCNSLGGIGVLGSQAFFGWFSDYRMREGFTGRP